MITIENGSLTPAQWSDAVGQFLDLSLLQTWDYGEAKTEGGWQPERLLFRRGRTLVAVAQVMVRRLPVVGGGLAWVNRGPLWRRRQKGDDANPAEVMEALRSHYLKRGFYLRVAPATTHMPLPAGFAATGRPGWASAVVDLTPPIEVLRAQVARKWRNRLSKAERSGMTVEWGDTGEAIATFIDFHRRFLAERAFPTTVTADLLSRLCRRVEGPSRPAAFIARKDDMVVGGLMMVRYGGICEYMAGSGTTEGRKLSSGHLLLWTALCEMREAGDKACDLGGLDELRTPAGIAEFKSDLKGAPYRLAEEIDACPWTLQAHLVRWRVRRALAGMDEE